MFEQFTADARAVVTSAHEEARLRGDRRLGTEHFLLGVLRARDSGAARALGVDLAAARAALDDLDRAALAVVGIDVRGIERAPIPASRKRTPHTSAARSIITLSAAEARRTGSRRIGPDHLLLALLARERPDPAAELMAHLGIAPAAVRDRL
ncbi:Clp protease N-terminal domain-containing protein [Streptomyces capparidis]